MGACSDMQGLGSAVYAPSPLRYPTPAQKNNPSALPCLNEYTMPAAASVPVTMPNIAQFIVCLICSGSFGLCA